MTLYTNMPFTQAAPIWLFPVKDVHISTKTLVNSVMSVIGSDL